MAAGIASSREAWLELDSHEICNQLEITTGNLWVPLHGARLRVRDCLQVRWFDGQSAS